MTYPPQPGDYDPYGNPTNPYSQPTNPYEQYPDSPAPDYRVPAQLPGYYFPTPPTPVLGPRPRLVTFAAMLIVLTVLVNVSLGLLMGFGMVAPESVSGEEVNRGGAIAVGVVSIVIGCGFIAAALGILRGRSGARVAAFVLYGISSCCGGVLTFGAIGYAVDPRENAGVENTVFAVICAVALASYLLVIVLLASRPANRWFREQRMARHAGLIS